jgi:hypothetical protein
MGILFAPLLILWEGVALLRPWGPLAGYASWNGAVRLVRTALTAEGEASDDVIHITALRGRGAIRPECVEGLEARTVGVSFVSVRVGLGEFR